MKKTKNLLYLIMVLLLLISTYNPFLYSNDKLIVSMSSIPNMNKEETKLIQKLSVDIMNTLFVKFIKYGKINKALKKEDIEIENATDEDLINAALTYNSKILIMPTISFATNIVTNESRITNAAMTDIEYLESLLEEIEDIENEEIFEEMENENDIENIWEVDIEPADDDEITEILKSMDALDTEEQQQQSITSTQTLDDTIPEGVQIEEPQIGLNAIDDSITNITYTTNITKVYNFDVLDIQTTNSLYTTNITRTNDVNIVSTGTINALKFYQASLILNSLLTNEVDENNKYAEFWIEKKMTLACKRTA